MFRAAAVILIVCAVAAAVLIDRLPPEDVPFIRVDLERPVGFATGMKLSGLRGDLGACQDAVARSKLVARHLPDRDLGGFCRLHGVVQIERSSIPWSTPPRATCALAAALYVWEREVVAPAAARHLGTTVTRIDHFGTYACRTVRGSSGSGSGGRPSEHATANAIDVAGFRLANGRRITVARNWNGDGPAAPFLHDVRDGSCRLFRAVLSPEYNAAHADHFHLDMGRWGICR